MQCPIRCVAAFTMLGYTRDWYCVDCVREGVHGRGCTGITILAQSYISNILIQCHSDVSFIHKCELDERVTMMLVWPACVL